MRNVRSGHEQTSGRAMALALQCWDQQTGYSFVQLKGCGIHKLPYSARTACDTTSVEGRNRKSSMRAHVFRFAPKSGHCATESACPFRSNNRHRLDHDPSAQAAGIVKKRAPRG